MDEDIEVRNPLRAAVDEQAKRSKREERFAQEFQRDRHVRRAAIRAGYDEPTAEAMALAAACAMTLVEGVTPQRVVEGLAHVAFASELAQTSDRVNALDKLGKHLGIYQEDRRNDADRHVDLMGSVYWRYVTALHLVRGIPLADAIVQADTEPEVIEAWGREKGLLPPANGTGQVLGGPGA